MHVIRSVAVWMLGASVLSAFLAACGGGSDGPTSPPETGGPTTVTVTTSVDSSLQAPGALVIAKAMTTVETQAMGVTVVAKSDPDSVVYAVDEAGNVALAANIANGRATFSAEGTVLAFGATVLATESPNQTPEQLRTSLRNADGFATLVSDIAAAILAGKSPLDEPGIQQGFDRVLTSAARATAQVQAGRVRPLTVAPIHAKPSYEPSVLETSRFKVSIANQFSEEYKFDSKVYLRNTSAVSFTASLLDSSGAQRTSNLLKGAGPTVFSLAVPIEIAKPFAGSFSVRLSIDDKENKAALTKMFFGLINVSKSECANSIYKVVAGMVVDVSFGTVPKEWLKEVLIELVWATAKGCIAPFLKPETGVSLLEAYFKITKVVGIARFLDDRIMVPAIIPDTGVCLSEGQYQMSCVASISATAIHPMMPGAVQPISIEFFGEDGKKTLAPPYGLDIRYSTPDLFELIKLGDTFTLIKAGPLEGAGEVKMIDPATDKELSLRVTVTKGKLDQSAYRVPVNRSVAVRLIDPASGADVYRQPATFDIFLADSKHGNFSFSDEFIGGITFQASAIANAAPQPIFLDTGNSGSTLSVYVEPSLSRYTVSSVAADPPIREGCVNEDACNAELFCSFDEPVSPGAASHVLEVWTVNPSNGTATLTNPDGDQLVGSYEPLSGSVSVTLAKPPKPVPRPPEAPAPVPPEVLITFSTQANTTISGIYDKATQTVRGRAVTRVENSWSKDARTVGCEIQHDYVSNRTSNADRYNASYTVTGAQIGLPVGVEPPLLKCGFDEPIDLGVVSSASDWWAIDVFGGTKSYGLNGDQEVFLVDYQPSGTFNAILNRPRKEVQPARLTNRYYTESQVSITGTYDVASRVIRGQAVTRIINSRESDGGMVSCLLTHDYFAAPAPK